MTFSSNKQRQAVMARMGKKEAMVLNQLLMQPNTTVRKVKIKGKEHLERRLVIGNKIILERVKIDKK